MRGVLLSSAKRPIDLVVKLEELSNVEKLCPQIANGRFGERLEIRRGTGLSDTRAVVGAFCDKSRVVGEPVAPVDGKHPLPKLLARNSNHVET